MKPREVTIGKGRSLTTPARVMSCFTARSPLRSPSSAEEIRVAPHKDSCRLCCACFLRLSSPDWLRSGAEDCRRPFSRRASSAPARALPRPGVARRTAEGDQAACARTGHGSAHACKSTDPSVPEPVVVLPDGTSSTLPVPPGPSLAAGDTAPFPATTIYLPKGSTPVMGTTALAGEAVAPTGVLRPHLDETCNSPHLVCATASNRLTWGMAARARPCPCSPSPKRIHGERVMTCGLPAGPEAAKQSTGPMETS